MTATADTLLPVDPLLPVELTAGPVTATLDRGTLRWLRAGRIEIVRGIYGAIRDPDWGTIEPVFDSYRVRDEGDAFVAEFRAMCRREADGAEVAWTGRVAGSRDGTIEFSFDGLVMRPYSTARIGLCVLHPPRLAGDRVEVETPFGVMRGRFPDLITGYLPFTNVTRIRHDLSRSHETSIAFSGDLFEMEDQRAFGDASFKTFSRPLALPWPYRVDAGTAIRQSVTVSVPRATGARRRSTTMPDADPAVIRVVPGRGTSAPDVGSGIAPADVVGAAPVADAIRTLGLQFVRVVVEAGSVDADAQLTRALDTARSAGCALDLAVVASPVDAGLEAMLARVAAAGVPVVRVEAFDPDRHTTPAALAVRCRDAMRSAGLAVPLFGGSRGYLYQLVADGLPAELVDGVAYPLNPQVHTVDEGSIMEAIEVLPATVRTGLELGAGRPVAVGPLSLKALFNPDVRGPEPAPAPGDLPARYDARQPTMFAAAWTLGAACALASAGAAALTLHEVAGWAGLVAAEQPGLARPSVPAGTILPVGHVVAAVAGLRGVVLGAEVSGRRLAAMAVEGPGGRLSILIANLDDEPARVVVDPGKHSRIDRAATLDREDPAAGWGWQPTDGASIRLRGHGVAWLEGHVG